MAAGDGLISMTPTSIAYSGTSASINADGGVDFTAVTSLSLNGVFTSGFDNYLVVILTNPSTTAALRMRLRASGTDDSSNQTQQYVSANSTTIGGARQTVTSFDINYGDTGPSGVSIHLYGPYLAQATAGRKIMASNRLGAFIEDYAFTHSATTQFDGATFLVGSGTVSGNIVVFGYEE